jgi:methionyl-tRNA synthetase
LLLKPGEPLFKKYDALVAKEHIVKEQSVEPTTAMISIDDFAKVKLVLGTIQSCDIVPKSDKLYQLMVDFGDKGTRQILSGVRPHFTQEQLVGKQAIFVFNLPPRTMMGVESQGMLLVAQDANGTWHIVNTATSIPNGATLR